MQTAAPRRLPLERVAHGPVSSAQGPARLRPRWLIRRDRREVLSASAAGRAISRQSPSRKADGTTPLAEGAQQPPRDVDGEFARARQDALFCRLAVPRDCRLASCAISRSPAMPARADSLSRPGPSAPRRSACSRSAPISARAFSASAPHGRPRRAAAASASSVLARCLPFGDDVRDRPEKEPRRGSR